VAGVRFGPVRSGSIRTMAPEDVRRQLST